MFIIKQIPQDFVVKEILSLELEDSGDYSYYTLKKEDISSDFAISKICNLLRINRKKINLAGLKDKKAITYQTISIFKGPKRNFKTNNMSLTYVGCGPNRLHLGQNESNEFEIVVRNLTKKYKEISKFENYFDEQRFSKVNAIVGKFLLTRKFREACELLNLDTSNPINSLSKIPNLRFYLHSYQSLLFNNYLESYILNSRGNVWKVEYSQGNFIFSNTQKNEKIPLLSFDTNLGKFPRYKEIMENEKIVLKDFIIKQFPKLIDESPIRNSLVKVTGLKVNYFKDELNKDKLKAKLCFSLPPGSYATILIKKMFTHKL